MNKHKQIHTNTNATIVAIGTYKGFHTPYTKPSEITWLVNIDRFFEQPQNLRDGHIDTSPIACASASAVGHYQPLDGNTVTSKSDGELHESVISKHCSTPAEVARLAVLRPSESDYPSTDNSDVVADVSE